MQPLAPATEEASSSQSKPKPKPTIAATPAKSASPANTQFEQAQVNALYSLLEDRYSKKYALSPGVLKPASSPEYYTKLMEEIEKAPKKSWWEAKVDEWKMKIRWS